jgi:hypothetical protein
MCPEARQMRRALTIVGVACASLAWAPALAFAEESLPASAYYPLIGVSFIGLAVAAVLLVQALSVRKIALGGAIAEKMSYVILAILCLAASALTEWAVNFTAGVTIAQAQLAREVLVIVAMALLAAYFYSVRAAMNSYLRSMQAEKPAAPAPSKLSEADRG